MAVIVQDACNVAAERVCTAGKDCTVCELDARAIEALVALFALAQPVYGKKPQRHAPRED